jgi:hypothetical protein
LCGRQSNAFDKSIKIAAINLLSSKAFFQSSIILSKAVKAYGLSENSLKLIKSYLENRRQRIKIGNNYSEWDTLIKGVPQGSILDPVLFNVFINDIFLFVQDSTIYIYADDNTLSNFNINKLCGRQSNAFDKSIKIVAINLLSSKAFFQSSIILSKAV